MREGTQIQLFNKATQPIMNDERTSFSYLHRSLYLISLKIITTEKRNEKRKGNERFRHEGQVFIAKQNNCR